MSIIKPTRRGLITGLASLIAAPALVKASSLMPVKAWVEPGFPYDGLHPNADGFSVFLGTNDLDTADPAEIMRNWNLIAEQFQRAGKLVYGPYSDADFGIEGRARPNFGIGGFRVIDLSP